jgi:long-chain acyl-CoA synthetase
MTALLNLLQRHAQQVPDSPCLISEGEIISFAELDRRSDRLASALVDLGVRSGDRVAILSGMSPNFFELLFACSKIGAIMMPLNWRLSAREIAGILADGMPALILVSDEHQALLGETTVVCPTIGLDAEYEGWRDAGAFPAPSRVVEPDAVILLLYTSGTTGLPKGVMITERNLSYVEPTAREIWGFGASSVNLVAMPLFHIGGIGYGMMALTQGGQTVLLKDSTPSALLNAIDRWRVTHAFFVPTVIQRLTEQAELEGTAPTSLEIMIYGAAPIGLSLLRRAMETFGCGFSHAYGMTETSGTVISLPPEEHRTDCADAGRLKSCGRALPWVQMELRDHASGAATPTGEIGEIHIRSAAVMKGYWQNPEETRAALTADGWLRTGDAAWQDEQGFVYIHDRYKDMIVSGGENIYPTELELVLHEHTDIAEVAVIGVAHERWGETPRAYVVCREDASPAEADLLEFVRARVAHYKCPTSVVFVDALPRTASGKVLKPGLRALEQSDGPA